MLFFGPHGSWVLPSAAARACSIGIRIMMGIIVTVFLVMSHEMQSAVNKSQLCLLLLWCTKVQDEELELQVTLPYFTMRLQKDCVSSFFFFFPKTFSWRSNDMTVIEVSLRQIYHIESVEYCGKGRRFWWSQRVDNWHPDDQSSRRIWWIDLANHWCI